MVDAFDVDGTWRVIRNGGYQRFPADLLSRSATVIRALEERLTPDDSISFFILADTSYGSCCVDEVAAEHAQSDLVVHYGNSCLSPTSRLPVYYVFVQKPLDMEQLMSAFMKHFDQNAHDPICILGDVAYEHRLEHTLERVQKTHDNVHIAAMGSRFRCPVSAQERVHTGKESQFSGRTLPMSKEELVQKQWRFFYIGGEGPTLTSLLMNFNQCTVVSFDPASHVDRVEGQHVNRQLMKRYLLVEKAKDAEVIGILAGTLGVASYLGIMADLRQAIVQAGKKPFIVSVGKLNPAKLANFLEIDVFVLVACPETSLVDCKEFLKPIITPYELYMALSPSSEWQHDRYDTDFSRAINLNCDGADTIKEELPTFSLATGAYTKRAVTIAYDDRHTPDIQTDLNADLNDESNRQQDLVRRQANSQELIQVGMEALMRGRTWRGLERATGEQEAPAALEEGRRGIASGYADEPPLSR